MERVQVVLVFGVELQTVSAVRDQPDNSRDHNITTLDSRATSTATLYQVSDHCVP